MEMHLLKKKNKKLDELENLGRPFKGVRAILAFDKYTPRQCFFKTQNHCFLNRWKGCRLN